MRKDLQFTMYDLRPKNRNLFFILCSFFIVIFCRHDADEQAASPYFTNFFTGNEADVLRGINFNMTAEDVKKTEQSRLYETTADHLFYVFSFPTDSTAFSEYADVQYFFNENNQLDVIANHIYLNDTIQRDQLQHTLSQDLSKRFGKPETNTANDKVWTADFKDKISGKKYNYTITVERLEDEEDPEAIGVTIEYYLKR